jgi:PhnB protein
MSSGWKRPGYSSVSVYLVTQGAQQVIDLLKNTFDATDLRRFDGPDGKIMHAELRIDDTVVMIADAGGNYPAFPVWLHVYVQDVDATYKRALAAGGVPVQEPIRKRAIR